MNPWMAFGIGVVVGAVAAAVVTFVVTVFAFAPRRVS